MGARKLKRLEIWAVILMNTILAPITRAGYWREQTGYLAHRWFNRPSIEPGNY